MIVKSIWLAVWLVLLPGFGLSAQETLKIHVSVMPQKYFVEQIARDLAEVDVLVAPGKSPATYSPTPDQIRKLARSDVYFRIGVPFENGFLHKISAIAPNIRVVDTRRGIRLRDMETHIHEQDEPGEPHSHGHSHESESSRPDEKAPGSDRDDVGKDPHTWMNPLLVKQQAVTIANTLSELAPQHKARFQENLARFSRDLDQLYARLHALLSPLAGENMFVFHPAFGYFADAFGLKQIPVETMGRSPKGKELSAIIKLARQENTRVIFVQPQFDSNAARKIAQALNAAVVSIDPLAYDYLNNMTQMADAIAGALAP
ncbi:MAG: metal ABC transporter solute-binding protein, Zn/Mn family [Thermodesulfobacteriota bacterium]